jgi:hypothetical protein
LAVQKAYVWLRRSPPKAVEEINGFDLEDLPSTKLLPPINLPNFKLPLKSNFPYLEIQ